MYGEVEISSRAPRFSLCYQMCVWKGHFFVWQIGFWQTTLSVRIPWMPPSIFLLNHNEWRNSSLPKKHRWMIVRGEWKSGIFKTSKMRSSPFQSNRHQLSLTGNMRAPIRFEDFIQHRPIFTEYPASLILWIGCTANSTLPQFPSVGAFRPRRSGGTSAWVRYYMLETKMKIIWKGPCYCARIRWQIQHQGIEVSSKLKEWTTKWTNSRRFVFKSSIEVVHNV